MKHFNGMMMQYFEWYMDCNQNLWNIIKDDAARLAEKGVTSIWLPPAYKGAGGKYEVGYGVYDVYDLGEFDQKDTVKTKYGSKDEYLKCIDVLKKNGIAVYADIVLNHKMGADAFQFIPATKMDFGDHNRPISDQETVKVATKFVFPGRNNKYSDFKWNWTHFTGVDYDDNTGEHAIFKFKDKNWGGEVDEEFGNFDYLMGADLDFSNRKVVEECINWGNWYIEETGIDGFRLDAIKHIPATFYKEWVKTLRQKTNKDLFTVGEYWSADLNKLRRYLSEVEGEISLFDVPLHFNLFYASIDDNYDLTKILDNTLVKDNPSKAVTFVDNHDTQPSQSLQSFVAPWFKQAAYSIILLRDSGYPCVFYGDYHGIPHDNVEKVKDLDKLMDIREERAFGIQHDYLDHPNVIGWTREGDPEVEKSGIAVIISNRDDCEKTMYIGTQFTGEAFIDALGNCEEEVQIDETGSGLFKVKAKSASVWIRK